VRLIVITRDSEIVQVICISLGERKRRNDIFTC
jgi:hypothetical protein